MTTASGIGIGIGIGVVIGFGFAFVFLAGMNQDTPIIENIPEILYSDDARLAQITANYYDDQGRLLIALILTDSDGEFTKASGHVTIRIVRFIDTLYSYEFDFVKADFLTWDNLFLGKQKGVWFNIYENFPAGSAGQEYTVYVELETKSGKNWELQTTFRSY